ncbi:MAG: hypothetical protein WBL27_12610 [Salinimicrobium sp.]
MSLSKEKIYGVKQPKKKTIYDSINEYTQQKYEVRFDELGQEF